MPRKCRLLQCVWWQHDMGIRSERQHLECPAVICSAAAPCPSLQPSANAEFNSRLRQQGLPIVREETACQLCCLLLCALCVWTHKHHQWSTTIRGDEQLGHVLSTCMTPGVSGSCRKCYCFPTAEMARKQHWWCPAFQSGKESHETQWKFLSSEESHHASCPHHPPQLLPQHAVQGRRGQSSLWGVSLHFRKLSPLAMSLATSLLSDPLQHRMLSHVFCTRRRLQSRGMSF